jgi:hypothetical protein
MLRFAKPRLRVSIWIPLVIILLLGLPLAVWLDLRKLTDEALRRQAMDFNSLITSVRITMPIMLSAVSSLTPVQLKSVTTIKPFQVGRPEPRTRP